MMRRNAALFSTLAGNGIVGIRREDKNVWERRVPLTPPQVSELLHNGKVKRVIVQPSSTRCYANDEFARAGAEINEDLSEANAVVAVKEVPAQLLLSDRTYMFFSHTIKAQDYNMPLLDTVLKKNIRLIDYEPIVNQDGRMVKFGPYAGYGGMIDTLHSLGLALLTRGFATPFLHLSLSKEYTSLETAREDLRKIGDEIRHHGLPEDVCPLTITITGSGSVSQAAQQILHLLPCKYVAVEDLPKLWAQKTKDTKCIHVVIVRAKDMVAPRDSSKKFSTRDYYENPSEFVPTFHEKVAPYTRVLINGMYWEPRFPRLLTTDQACELQTQDRFPLLALGDITCDIGGSVEFFVRSTTIQNPLYFYDLKTKTDHEMHEFKGEGVLIQGVDHIPAEFPKEASTDFGRGLVPLIERVALSSGLDSLEEQRKSLGNEIFGAVITSNGKLTPKFEYITELRAKNEAEGSACAKNAKKNVLVFGAGMTSGPCVQHLLQNPQNIVTLVDSSEASLKNIVNKFYTGKGELLTQVADATTVGNQVQNLIKDSDIVVSMLPAYMHAPLAEVAVENQVPMVTASYISPQMEMLRPKAEEKKTIVVNEMGLDPGIDIMTSAKLLREIREDGGVIKKYVSLCGALPTPECSACPLGYKFSWSPRGVLTAATRPTRFLAGGTYYDVPGDYLYHLIQPLQGFKGMDLHWIPNGNSEKYAQVYDLKDADTIVRGTFRYSGFAPAVIAFKLLGLLDFDTPVEQLYASNKQNISWAALLKKAVNCGDSPLADALTKFLTNKIGEARSEVQSLDAFKALRAMSLNRDSLVLPDMSLENEVMQIISTFNALGLLSEESIAPKTTTGLAIDSLCSTLVKCLSMEPHERDFNLMIHFVTAHFPKTNKTKMYKATLAYRGQDLTNTATAVTVGLPVGATAQLVLDGGLEGKSGLLIPTDEAIYNPVLATLEKRGIRMIEEVIDL